MLKPNSIRYGGPAPVLGGSLFFTLFALEGFVDSGALAGTFFGSHWGHQALVAGTNALLAISATGLYVRHADHLGRLGTVGFYLSSAGFALAVLGSVVLMKVELGVGEGTAPLWLTGGTCVLATLLFGAGSVAFAVTSYEAGILRRGGAVLLTAGPLLLLGMLLGGIQGWSLMVPTLLLGAGWAWLAYALLSEEAAGEQTSTAGHHG